jgi:HAD superfamily hydrolase (TIGR01484 family)
MLQGGRLIKLMIFDVDDTLAKRNEPIGDGVVRFLKMAESAGIRVAMISGKPMMYVVGLARQVGLANPILSGENGAHIQYSTVIPPEREIALAASANSAEEFSVLRTEISRVFGDDVWFQPNSVNLSVFPMKEKLRTSVFDFVHRYVEENVPSSTVSVYDHPTCVEIVPFGVDKGCALARIRELEGLEKSEVLAVGDSENDVPMFREAGVSVGVNLPQANYSFSGIEDVVGFITRLLGLRHPNCKDETMKIDSEQDFVRIEYAQVCDDWRHRDSMLWQSFAVAVAVTGFTVERAFSKEVPEPFAQWVRIVLLTVGVIFNVILLLKIYKDHLYQEGSAQLLDKWHPEKSEGCKRQQTESLQSPKCCYRKCPPNRSAGNWLARWLTQTSAFTSFLVAQVALLVLSTGMLLWVVYPVLRTLLESIR